MCKELRCLANGYKQEGPHGTNTITFMTPAKIAKIPKDHTVMYAHIVADYQPQKDDPNRILITVEGNLINYPGKTKTNTADMIIVKLSWNSILSTLNTQFMTIDIGNFYHNSPMKRKEYMHIPVKLIPNNFMEEYKLHNKTHHDFIHMQINKGMYSLPQVGELANDLLKACLKPYRYTECPHTPGFWKHPTKPLLFTLVVDNFGVKYTNKDDPQHLINVLKKYYPVKIDWIGKLYCGIDLDWHYDHPKHLDISIKHYVQNWLHQYQHEPPKKPQNAPYPAQPQKHRPNEQEPLPLDNSPILSAKRKNKLNKS